MSVALGLTLVPFILAALSLAKLDFKSFRVLAGCLALLQLALTLWICYPSFRGDVPTSFLGWFRLDSFAAWMVCVNTLVYSASMASAALMLERPGDLHLSEKGGRALFGLASLFIVAANAVVCAADLGAMWVAMEATTLVTAPLILLRGTKKSIEAAWKYLILCGVGIAFALLGTVFLLASAGEGGSLSLAWLTSHAGQLKKSLLDTSFVFFLLGYGTKAGLFPVHNWLPDAHSEAPAPASALLSGALLNCAMAALWRIGGVIELSGSRTLLPGLLGSMGALTVLAAGIMLVRQRDLKRMWAYSSIENMGLLAVAVALRAAPIFALHALAHSLAKSSAFLLSGNVVRSYGSVALNRISGVMRRFPGLGFGLVAAGAAVMGAPPFGSFVSEWLLLARTADSRQWGILAALVVGLGISFIAVLIHLGRAVFGEKPDRAEVQRSPGSVLPAALLLAVSAFVFIAVAPVSLDYLGHLFANGGHP